MKRFSTRALFSAALATGFFLLMGSAAQAQNTMSGNADQKFATEAAHGGAAEVQLGKLAEEKAQNPDVKAFGERMVHDHSEANDKLMAVGQQDNMSLPSQPDPKQMAEYQKLSKLSGAAFDKAYVEGMVEDHEKDVKAFKKEAKDGADPKIKQFASETLPVLQGHLDAIKTIHSKMSGGM